MALFKKKPKVVETDSGSELFEKGYLSLTEALVGEFSTGSLDVKETVITFEDREVHVISYAGAVKKIKDSTVYLDAQNRFKWIYNEDIPEVLKNVSTLEDIEKIFSEELVDDKEVREVLEECVSNYFMHILKKTNDDFADHEKVRSEISMKKNSTTNAKMFNFTINAPDVEKVLKAIEDKSSETLKDLRIYDFEPSQVTVSTNVDSTVSNEKVASKLVFEMASKASTLEDIKKESKGFLYIETLEALSELFKKGVVYLEDPERLQDVLELPDLNEPVETIKPKVSTDLVGPVLVGPVVELANSVEDNSAFASTIDAEDDGNFMYELLDSDSPQTVTVGIDDDIEDDVRNIINRDDVTDSKRIEVLEILRRNTTLEAELSSIERSILDSRARYHKNVEEYEGLKTDEDHPVLSLGSETDKDTDSDFKEMAKKQDTSNGFFFTVSKLEEDRYVVNIERKSLLEELVNAISELAGEGVQGVLKRIDNKLYGISDVSNIAYHSPKDDENEVVDPELLDSNFNEKESAILELSYEDTPSFAGLIESLGFDPFNL